MAKISVTIPAYNEEKGILSTLEDLNAQTNQDFEVIVVNNNSTDDTVKIVNDFSHKAKYPLKVLDEPEPGVGHARKKGADDAISRNISILAGTDADCDIHPEWIDGILASLVDDKIGAVTGKLIWSSKRLASIAASLAQKTQDKLTTLFTLNNLIVEHTLREPLLSGSNFGIHTDAYIKAGGFIQPYFEGKLAPQEDWDLGRKLYELGYKTEYTKTDNPSDPRRVLEWLIAEDEPEILYGKILTHVRSEEFNDRLNHISDDRIALRLRRVLLFQVFSPVLTKRTAKPEMMEWFLGERTEEFIKDFDLYNVATLEDKKIKLDIREKFLDKYFEHVISRMKKLYLV